MIEIINIKSKFDITKETWDKFITSFDYNSDVNNFKYDFKIMTKRYGKQYIDFCIAAWQVNCNIMIEEEFCEMNANMPIGFFNSKIKNVQTGGGDSDQT